MNKDQKELVDKYDEMKWKDEFDVSYFERLEVSRSKNEHRWLLKQFITTLLKQKEEKHKEEIKKLRDECVGEIYSNYKMQKIIKTKRVIEKYNKMGLVGLRHGYNQKRQEVINSFNKHIK